MTTERPQITRSITLTDLTTWYWLKTDLVLICRSFGLSTAGTKIELEDRLRGQLSGQPVNAIARRREIGEMPGIFTPETVIGVGWRCNPALGAYFRKVIGTGFRFNAVMRNFIHNEAGRTLADAVTCFRASTTPGTHKNLIPRQLEYNQHFRDFFAAHPGATREQAIAAWWDRRSRRTVRRG